MNPATSILRLAALAAFGICASRPVLASDYIGPNDGRWSDPRNWNPAGVPGAGGTANVIVAPAEPFTIWMDFTYAPGTALNAVNIDSTVRGALTVFANANLYSINENIGLS